MTSSRWIGVCIFLYGILYSYTSGAPLEKLWRLNFYFRDYRLFDRNSMRKEGSVEVIDSVFEPKYFEATWLQQIGSNFGEVEQFAWSEAESKLYFVDSVNSKIFSYHTWTGLDIEYEFNHTKTGKEKTFARNGPSGIALDIKEANTVYISMPSKIVRLNLKNGKPLPLDSESIKEYLYFTVPQSSGVYRVTLGAASQTVERVTTKVKTPTQVAFSTRNPKQAFVGNCVEGDYSVYVFEVDQSEKEQWTLKQEWNIDSLQWNNSTIKKQAGCVRGLTSVNGNLLVTCPGGRICIVNEQTGALKAAVKLYDNVVLNDVAIGANQIWMASNFSFWRAYLNVQKQKTDL
ncbi:hypothetical protein RFI_24022 [Reticulomyxa filosa]|uniref:SMP-30/Gluconolactonase/LRE-like region domain-containing protein n=1 Tax=Reticulomyxa filosa TaxID=46433 RepID=X6MHK2_RETFI|nr:hypothetical protein RFI_24022 [Reticulomyxa filosa]|eukprot:ETO13354.1 hypothetical protein RFI_24022 [Reticulomyxa filosa]